MDYRDKKPHLNAPLFKHLVSGCGLRQAGRMLPLTRRCVEMKARKIGRHLRRQNLNLQGELGEEARLQFDEFETYESCRNTRPLTLPVLIEARSRFIIWAESATIRPKGRMTPKRVAAIAHDALVFGPRVDRSKPAIQRTLCRAMPLLAGHSEIFIDTDEKSIYPRLIAKALLGKTVEHRRTSGKRPRTTSNPLFPINQTEAIAMDLMGRLRRDSWLSSKKRRWLDVALHLFLAYRNLIRPRFNSDKQSPAALLDFLPRCLRFEEALAWRQDWGVTSIHPLSRTLRSIAQYRQTLC